MRYLFEVSFLWLVCDDVLPDIARGSIPGKPHAAVGNLRDGQLARWGQGHCEKDNNIERERERHSEA